MAGSVNKVILVGNLGKDPEIRRTQDGRPIANLSIATSETWRDKGTGERKEKTEWHRVVIFNEGLCKVAEQYLKKGAKVYIEGALQTRKWTDQAGVEKYSTEVVLQGFNSTLTMLDGRSGGGGGSFGSDDSGGDFGSGGPVSSAPRRRFPTAIVRHDPNTGLPLRDSAGFCILAATGEAGEAIGRIGDGGDGSGRFEGYTDKTESERKVLRNVFAEGDAWFRTGDLMRMDAAGHFYFVDRIGDTFRWKGENVSTLEVETVLASTPGVVDAVVYGVSVPGNDGKAGMAFLETASGFNPEVLLRQAAAQLPSYAMPVFIRTGAATAITETFKHKKQELVAAGFDPSKTSDAIYVQKDGSLMQLDMQLHARICAGDLRL